MIQKNITGIDHIALQLPSLDAGLEFFNELLGFKIKFETDFQSHRIVMLKGGKIEIELWERQAVSDPASGDREYGVHHFAIQVKDLQAVIDHMKQTGVEILTDIYEPTRGIREAIVQGPGGVRVQFVEQNIPLLIWRTIKGDFKEN